MKAVGDPEVQSAVRALCTADPIFWFNHFAWTYDPRLPTGQQVIPFILWDFQKDLIFWLLENIEATMGSVERRNLVIEKSRDMGVSWVVFLFFLWYWLFRNGSFLIGSRKQEEVDVLGDLDTPFEKLRFNLRKQPTYLMPPGFDWNGHSKHLILINPLGGEITGEASTANFARGGRKLAIAFDEHAAMGNDDAAWTAAGGSTNVRISISTPAGPNNKFYRLVHKKDKEDVEVKRIHWTLHPFKSAGLTIDQDGKPTSPWYEAAKLTMSPEDVARELDINYATSLRGLVFPDYTELHRCRNLEPNEKGVIVRAFDPGLTFACLWVQFDNYGRVLVLRELVMDDARIHDFGAEVLQVTADLEHKYKKQFQYDDCGDPAGASRSSASQEQPEYLTLAYDYGLDIDFAFMSEMPTRLRVKNRLIAIHNVLKDFCPQKQTLSLLVDYEQCPLLDEALREGYRYKVDKYSRIPSEQIDEKHPFEDVVDCLGYAILYRRGLGTKSSSRQPLQVSTEEIRWTPRRRSV